MERCLPVHRWLSVAIRQADTYNILNNLLLVLSSEIQHVIWQPSLTSHFLCFELAGAKQKIYYYNKVNSLHGLITTLTQLSQAQTITKRRQSAGVHIYSRWEVPADMTDLNSSPAWLSLQPNAIELQTCSINLHTSYHIIFLVPPTILI